MGQGAVSSSRGSSQPRDQTWVRSLTFPALAGGVFTTSATWEAPVCYVMSVMSDSTAPGTVAFQAPLSIRFSRREYWNGLPFSPPGDLPNPGIEPASLTSPALAGRFFITGIPGYTPIKNFKNKQERGMPSQCPGWETETVNDELLKSQCGQLKELKTPGKLAMGEIPQYCEIYLQKPAQ